MKAQPSGGAVPGEAPIVEPPSGLSIVPPAPEVPPEAAARRPRRIRALLIVMCVTGLGLAAWGITGFLSASSDRDSLRALQAELSSLAAQQDRFEAKVADIEGQIEAIGPPSTALRTALLDLESAISASVDSENTLSDLLEQASSLYNAGKSGAERALLNGKGRQALAGFRSSLTKARQALSRVQTELNELEGAL